MSSFVILENKISIKNSVENRLLLLIAQKLLDAPGTSDRNDNTTRKRSFSGESSNDSGIAAKLPWGSDVQSLTDTLLNDQRLSAVEEEVENLSFEVKNNYQHTLTEIRSLRRDFDDIKKKDHGCCPICS
jgi:hypothetical protein